ncbi:MAG: FAD binding domain-containing protein [Beijerinckiaceae bacterium]
MKMPPFAYAKARDLPELFRLWKSAGDDARLLAGGQTLLATLAFRLSEPSVLIDITEIDALKGVSDADDSIRIGALTTHAELGSDRLVARHAPLLTAAVPSIAHAAIRNRGTIGGSLAYADPAAELPACMVALGATIVARSSRGERRIRADKFFTGLLTTALKEHEIIAAVEVPKAARSQSFAIDEIARRSGDYAMAGLACALTMGRGRKAADVRLVFFGVGDGPARAATAEAALAGNSIDPAAIAAAQAALSKDLDPPADMHGSSAFKLQLCRTLLSRLLPRALPDAKEAA